MVLYIFYFLTLFILITLFLLFVLSYTIRIEVTPLSLRISLFRIPIISKQKEKLYSWLIKLIEKAQKKEKIEMEYITLMDYIHIDKIEIIQNLECRKDVEIILYWLSTFFKEMCIPFQVKVMNKDINTKIKVRFHIYIGTMLLNYLHVKKEIENGKNNIESYERIV